MTANLGRIAWLTALAGICTVASIRPPHARIHPEPRRGERTLDLRTPALSRTLIQGVPFVPASEMVQIQYPERDHLPPADAACYTMVARHWGRDVGSTRQQTWEEALGWAHHVHDEASSLEELKPYLARAVPVIVSRATDDCGPGAAMCVVVGYDDAQRVLTVHDPVSGPNQKVSYTGFDAKWSATNRAFAFFIPREESAR